MAEIAYHESGELMYLVRGSIVAVIGGRTIADPSEADWQRMGPGDYLVVSPPRSKTDQFGEIHCPYPSILPFENTKLNAARRLRDAELRQPCHGEARATTPLFATRDGQPLRHGTMDRLLRAALTRTIGATAATLYSWHSARIGLACALRASGCPPDTVQLICRWMCPESLRVYALKGVSEHASWVVKAMRAHVDAVRGTSYPVISAGEGMVNMQAELTQQWTVGRQATTEAEPLTRAARVTPVRRQRLTNKPLLPKRDPALGRLMQQHRVMCPPGRVRVAEKQRLLLVACPRLAQRYEVPPDVLAAAGVASHAPEAPPSDIEDVN